MTDVLEERSQAVGQGEKAELRQGLIFEHSKRGRRGYQLPDLDVPDTPLDTLLPKNILRGESPMKGVSDGVIHTSNSFE